MNAADGYLNHVRTELCLRSWTCFWKGVMALWMTPWLEKLVINTRFIIVILINSLLKITHVCVIVGTLADQFFINYFTLLFGEVTKHCARHRCCIRKVCYYHMCLKVHINFYTVGTCSLLMISVRNWNEWKKKKKKKKKNNTCSNTFISSERLVVI